MINKNSIIGLSLFTVFVLSGCIAKTAQEPKVKVLDSYKEHNSNIELQKITYAKEYERNINKKSLLPVSTQACVGDHCQANIFAKNRTNQSREIKPFFASNSACIKKKEVIESVYDDNNYINRKHFIAQRDIKVITVPNRRIIGKTSIQVGAFRRYAGAKIYAKRYSLLSSKYKTIIRKDILDGKPIYRVRIKGFKNAREAKKFMSRYSLSGAFLVRR